MARKRFTEEQIIGILKKHEQGVLKFRTCHGRLIFPKQQFTNG